MALYNRFLTSATCFAIEYNDVLVLGITGYELEQVNYKYYILHSILTPPRLIWRERGCVANIAVNQSEQNKHVRVCNNCDEVR